MPRTGRTQRAARLLVLDLIDRIVHRITGRKHPDDRWPCWQYDDAFLARIAHGDVNVDWMVT